MQFTPQINLAIQVAATSHLGQVRKGDGIPYIAHPVAVAMIVAQYTNDEATICAALLHDVLEDVPAEIYSETQMLAEFGPEVVEIVKGVSEDKDASITPAEEKKTWKERKQKYLDNLLTDSTGSLMVCAADKIHNMQSTLDAYHQQGASVWSVFNSSPDDKLWFHTEVFKILKARLDNPIVGEVEHVFDKFARLVEGN